MAISIHKLTDNDLRELLTHVERHRAESGRGGDHHFMPFAPDDPQGPKGLDRAALQLRLDEIGWQRWWVAIDAGEVVGHVNLKGDGLKTGLHRCELGIGLERAYRGQGYGRGLMTKAIEYASSAKTLSWIDLRVFSHNAAGRALYQSLGFVEIGTIVDRFRIEGGAIDDVVMTLDVARPG